MHEDETLLCPFPERQEFALELSTLCQIRIAPENAIYALAQKFIQQDKFSAKDVLHVACASYAQANFFLTCEDALISEGQFPAALLRPSHTASRALLSGIEPRSVRAERSDTPSALQRRRSLLEATRLDSLQQFTTAILFGL
ncbi:hypothetical protein K9N68_29070 [Kovacikia minuta CCNUW1]|uniref:hypothetical protein n=1 Tax=Kovacikia minuta TaxID=2931930 RepID=UPI001CCB07C0|nr:hypothetical protein [Kovacikia minuta]UBF25582.1 hypothetical protein K9N68_29070 [Kovacikia minuta CCNUW1]